MWENEQVSQPVLSMAISKCPSSYMFDSISCNYNAKIY